MVGAEIPTPWELRCEQKWKINNGTEMSLHGELFGSEWKSPEAVREAAKDGGQEAGVKSSAPSVYEVSL